jgi:hypothetical protein
MKSLRSFADFFLYLYTFVEILEILRCNDLKGFLYYNNLERIHKKFKKCY